MEQHIAGDMAQQLSYVESVMRPLLGSEFVLRQRIVRLSQQFVKEVNQKVASRRPGTLVT
jgi:hypothetical protein